MTQQHIDQEKAIRALTARVARLESINDQLMTELQGIDQLLQQAGFDEGLVAIKLAAREVAEDIGNVH